MVLMLMVSSIAISSSCTLQIYGNANMDEIIDSADITYLEKVIKGEAEQTQFSDANDDGTIDQKDIDQVQKIIDGNEDNLIVFDDTARAVKIPEPVKSFVYHGHNSYVYETVRAIGAADRIIGITDRFITQGGNRYSKSYFPELLNNNVANVGDLQAVNYEVINNLNPDVVLTDAAEYYDYTKTPDTAVVALDVNITNSKEACMRYGYIFGKVSEAKEYLDWYTNIENKIAEKTKDIADANKPLVYVSSYNVDTTNFQVPARDNYRAVMAKNAGGRYIGDELSGTGIQDVDAEWVIARNPDVMIFSAANSILGYDITDDKNVTEAIDEFLKRPEFADVNAVKNKKIYMVSHPYILCGGASGLIGTIYYAKWLYPDLFSDIDAQAIHQEYVTKFQHLDIDVSKSISVYPPA
ncbi:MAG: Periplasmic binding protein [Methanosaeta sp. PtaU1.Bin060]|nr:MAG: Periplasmic binding protein [Methanosaeta sp. PtaU1.Bin060]